MNYNNNDLNDAAGLRVVLAPDAVVSAVVRDVVDENVLVVVLDAVRNVLDVVLGVVLRVVLGVLAVVLAAEQQCISLPDEWTKENYMLMYFNGQCHV